MCGYQLPHLFFRKTLIATPSVIGQDAVLGLEKISSCNLAARVIGYKEDDALPEGTIISQNPSPHSAIRSQQTVFLVLSRCSSKTEPIPSCKGSLYSIIQPELQKTGNHHAVYHLASNHPRETIIAQYLDDSSHDKKLVLYLAADKSSQKVMVPSFKNRPLQEVIDFLKMHSIHYVCTHKHEQPPTHTCNTCIVITQKPLPGSCICLETSPVFQLQLND